MKKIIANDQSADVNIQPLHRNDYFSVAIFLLYLMVDFVPQFGSYNYSEPQWLYLNFLNIIVLIYLGFLKKSLSFEQLNVFLKNKITFLYSLFIIISAFSIAVSINTDESVISITRYLVTFIAFFNLYFLFKNKNNLLLIISIVVSLVLFVECWNGLQIFFKNIGKINVDSLRLIMTTNHANKNIFSANILVKIPFVYYAIASTKSWKKIFFLAILCLAFLTVYLLSARAITIGMFLVLVLLTLGYSYKSILSKKINSNLIWTVVATCLSIIVLYFSIYIVKKNNFTIDQNGDKIKIENGTENRLKGISAKTESFQIRLHYWNSSVEIIKENPFLGCGLGSWKLRSMQYENKWKPNNSNGIHMHNDYLEVAAETGIINGLIYIILFIVLIYINFQTFIKRKSSTESLFALTLIGSIVGYGVDSFFNFPLSQPTMQILFAILLMLTICTSNVYQYSDDLVPNQNLIFPIIPIVLSLSTLYPNYLMFEFYKSINVTKIDNVALNLSYANVNSLFSTFPTLDDTASPVNDIKTRYLIKENQFKEALKSIEESNKINPYSLYANSLRVEMYEKMKLYDSVLKYNKLLFESQPSYPLFYERYIMSLARKKDTAKIQNTFKNLNLEFKNPKHYAYTFSYLLNAGLAPKESYKIVQDGLAKFPTDSILLDIKKDFSRMLEATAQNMSASNKAVPLDFDKALAFYLNEYKKNGSNFVNAENVGICYYQQKKYDLAIEYLKKVIDSKAFDNGKAEYINALCYYYKNDQQSACKYATISMNKNYPDAIQIKKMSCK